jgi:hypothetical protein
MPTPTGAWIPEAGLKKCKSDGSPFGWQASNVTEVLPATWGAGQAARIVLSAPSSMDLQWQRMNAPTGEEGLRLGPCVQEQVLLAAGLLQLCVASLFVASPDGKVAVCKLVLGGHRAHYPDSDGYSAAIRYRQAYKLHRTDNHSESYEEQCTA